MLSYNHGGKQEGHKEGMCSAVIVVPGGTNSAYGQRERWQYLLILQDVTQSEQHQSHWQCWLSDRKYDVLSHWIYSHLKILTTFLVSCCFSREIGKAWFWIKLREGSAGVLYAVSSFHTNLRMLGSYILCITAQSDKFTMSVFGN